MQRTFLSETNFITCLSPSLKRFLLEKLTGSQCLGLSQQSREVLDRIHYLSTIQDEDILLDYRSANGKISNTYDMFWDAVLKVISDKQAAEKRRHGTDSLLPYAMSVRHLSEQAHKLLPDDSAVPCDKTILLQFSPKDPFSHAALRHSNRFDMRFVMQARNLREKNPDAYYVACIKKYARSMMIVVKKKLKEIPENKNDSFCVVYTSSDDKHVINVGEPGYPLTPGTRQKPAISSSDESKHNAGDHDTSCKFMIQPTVKLDIDIPEKYEEGWYRGQVLFNNHDTVFNPSSHFRHLLLSLEHLRSGGKDGKVVLLIDETDGGTDHTSPHSSRASL